MAVVKTIKRGELARHGYVPPGGSARQVLTKTSNDDADLEYLDPITRGGSLGQSLKKTSTSDFDTEWGAGQYFPINSSESSLSITESDVDLTLEIGHVLRYGTNTAPGTTDMTTTIQTAINVAQLENGGRVTFPVGDYAISAQLDVTGKIDLQMDDGARIIALDSFPNVTNINQITWVLTCTTANAAGSIFRNVNLDGNAIAGGLQIQSTNNVRVLQGNISNMRANGTDVEDVENSSVSYVTYTSCGRDPITMSTGGKTSSLRCAGGFGRQNKFVTLDNNTILNSGGKGISIVAADDCIAHHNYVHDCTESHGAALFTSFSNRARFIGNTAIQGEDISTGAEVMKISRVGEECEAINNLLVQNLNDFDIMTIEDHQKPIIRGNTFRMTIPTIDNRQAIRTLDAGSPVSTGITIIGNSFIGAGTSVAISIDKDDTTIVDNYFENWTTGFNATGITSVVRGNSFRDVTVTYVVGNSANAVPDYSHVLVRSFGSATSGAGSFSIGVTIPQEAMDRQRMLRVKMAGEITGVGGNKTIAFRFGTTDFVFKAAANDTLDWFCEATVITVTSQTSERIAVIGFNGSTPTTVFGTATEDTRNDLFAGARITVANAGDVVTVRMVYAELLP